MAEPEGSLASAETPLMELDEQSETHLENSLNHLENFLKVFGFCQFSFLSLALSWASFLLLGVALPLLIIVYRRCSHCEHYVIRRFELQVLVLRSLAAAVSLIPISTNLRKFGLRKFLFVDRSHGHKDQFRDEYIKKILGFFKWLVIWLLPCLLLKVVREIVLVLHFHQECWWRSVAELFGLIFSWTYSTTIFLSGCALFHLVCNLLVIHFESYGKLLESDLEISEYIEEHIRLTHCLSKISHRFRIFFLLVLSASTATQFVALLQTTGNGQLVNLINGGNFAVTAIVELVGIIICLHGAAKITGRAQSVAAVASRWHSLVTCGPINPSQSTITINGSSSEPDSLPISYSEADLESVGYMPVPTNSQLASYMSAYHKREALVMYLQSNPGGFTVFGWTIDRGLIITIFFIEMSLVLFVLGETLTVS
ncbi:hypothetical protein K2173_001075 [Erythroxylum novogranatense]|uniref:Gustatory receptor n=1 Tax=Erythroxylum novogranatense TaxID=1862640 RepID=A0AAV8SIY3_9ROSI|nr:hypothetical protein K2173_001075 [Erythroxylum novogranatense]